LAWRSIDEPPAGEDPPWSFLSYMADPPLTADELASYLELAQRPSERAWVLVQPLAEGRYEYDTRALDLVLRMVAAKRARADAIFVPAPFRADSGLMRADGDPGELFLPWRTTAMMIAGADYLGTLQLPQGSPNHVFARGKEVTLVVWNDRSQTETLYLGEQVRVVDLEGRISEPRIVQDGDFLRHEIHVDRLPRFVTGLDPFVVRWRLAVQLESQELASVFGLQQSIGYQFSNTFRQGVGGTATLQAPLSWDIDNREIRYKLAAGESSRGMHHVMLAANATSGPQQVRLDFHVTAERRRFSVYRFLKVGLGDVEIEVATRVDEQGNLLVELELTNETDQPVSFTCNLLAPNRRRERRQVVNLGRGRKEVVFVLPRGKELVGKTLGLRAEEIGGLRVLSHQVTVRD
jgi:hypothetical protein